MTNIVALITVGNEILDGIVLDSNTHWMTGRLVPLGFMVKERLTVRDDVPEIGKAVRRAAEDGCDTVITCGGLGPTHDDMTLKGVADGLSLSLELNLEAKAIIESQHGELHRRGIIHSPELTEARLKMAYLPEGAKALDNKVGTAPGVLLEKDGCTFISLPGVPAEMMWIFDNQVLPILQSRVEGFYCEETFSLPLRDESSVSPSIDEAMKAVPGVWIKSLVKPFDEAWIRFWVSARGSSKAETEERVQRASEKLRELAKRIP